MKSIKKFILFLMFIPLTQTACKKEIMEVRTGHVTKVLTSTVYISGYLNSAGEGIKKYGHCLSVEPDPTLSDIKTEFSSTIGTGEFTSVIYNLEPGTTYYARGYISSGEILIYGDEITFTTDLHDEKSGTIH